MADIIKVSTAEMNACISRYKEAQGTMQDAQTAMSSAMSHLNNCWDGPAKAAMMAKWFEIEGNIQRSQIAINRTITGLRNTVERNEQAEETNTSTASALDVGTASTIYVEG